jgi:uncharacterized protein (DUF302 family)
MRIFFATAALCFLAQTISADIAPRPGWVVIPTSKDHGALLSDLKMAVKANGMGVVTQAGPTATAKKRGIVIPENRVVGVFNNNYAVKILATSTAAMIEAPVRFYITENSDGTATLSFKTPAHVFAPYLDEGGTELESLAGDLDRIFEAIALEATR